MHAGDVLEVGEISTPAAPGSGRYRLYLKSDGRAYKQASAGGEKAQLSANDEDQGPITGGAGITPKDLGSGIGTITIDVRDRPVQEVSNNSGAFSIDVAARTGSSVLIITNGASAGAFTTSAFDAVLGNAFTTTNGHVFRCIVECWGSGRKWLFVERII